jgi:hypothetical protein
VAPTVLAQHNACSSSSNSIIISSKGCKHDIDSARIVAVLRTSHVCAILQMYKRGS